MEKEIVKELQENLSVFIKENYKMSIEAEKIVNIYTDKLWKI